MGSTTTATALSDKASKLCWVLISTPDNQQPKPGWLWYQPTTISGLKQREHQDSLKIKPCNTRRNNKTPGHKLRRSVKKHHWKYLNYSPYYGENMDMNKCDKRGLSLRDAH